MRHGDARVDTFASTLFAGPGRSADFTGRGAESRRRTMPYAAPMEATSGSDSRGALVSELVSELDAVVVGGGPAGLNAALAFGRARRRVLLVDGGVPRNARAAEVHTFVTRDGIPPAEFRAIGRAQLTPYPSVEVRDAFVTSIVRDGASFVVTAGDAKVRARKLLLAVGVRDELPPIEGLADHWGHSVFQCPYCHGWEHRDLAWGVVVGSPMMAEWAPLLTGWTDRLTAFVHGVTIPADVAERLTAAGVVLEREAITRLVSGAPHGSSAPSLASVVLESGRVVPCSALVMHPKQHAAAVVDELGLARDDLGYVKVDERRESSVPGVYVAGDANTMRQGAIVAAADGLMAATMMNHALVLEDVARRVARRPSNAASGAT